MSVKNGATNNIGAEKLADLKALTKKSVELINE